MNSKRILGIVILIGGIALIFFSNYIKGRVQEGREQISDAQKQVDRSSGLFSLNPVTEELGKGVTGSAQKKIEAAKQEVGEYDELAKWLQIGGIALVVLGLGCVLFCRKK